MYKRHLFIIGYDISDAKRLRKVLHTVRYHALGGQKSFYECWLTTAELQATLHSLRDIIDPDEDKVVFIRLDGRTRSTNLGIADPIASTDYFYIG